VRSVAETVGSAFRLALHTSNIVDSII
jgi:hypothetical protein